MSANPEAFEFLRHAAYAHVRKHGKDRWQLLDFCNSTILGWMEEQGNELGETEALRISAAVAKWVFENYNPPREKPTRDGEQRAAEEFAVTFLYEQAAELYGRASVRKAALLGDKSKTTVARHLRQQGVAPVRQKKIAALPSMERRLVAILDETFPRDGAGIVLIDELSAALWDSQVSTPTKPLPEIPRSTKSTRRKTLREYLNAINGRGLGFHAVAMKDLVAIRRGRRFDGVKDTALWIDDERRLRGFRAIRMPKPDRGPLFWDDPWLDDLLRVLTMGLNPYFTSPADLEPLLRLSRPLLNVEPLYPWFLRAINAYEGDFISNLSKLSDRIVDPAVRRAAGRVASILDWMRAMSQYGDPFLYFIEADRRIEFMGRLRDLAPDSYARFGYVRDRILKEFDRDTPDAIYAAIRHCKQLGDQERSGGWQAPSSQDMAYFHPDNEAPF